MVLGCFVFRVGELELEGDRRLLVIDSNHQKHVQSLYHSEIQSDIGSGASPNR